MSHHERASAELNVANTAQKTLDREILETFEHRILTQSGAKQRIVYSSLQLPKELQRGNIMFRFTEDDIQRLLAADPDLTWSKLGEMEQQEDDREERIPVQTGLPARDFPDDSIQTSAGVTVGEYSADAGSAAADQKRQSLTSE